MPEDLKQAAIDALRALHADTSVSLEETEASLIEVGAEAIELANAVAEDIAARDGRD